MMRRGRLRPTALLRAVATTMYFSFSRAALYAENQNAPQEWRQRLWRKHLLFGGTCSILSPAHGSMIELTDNMDVVKVNARCRIKARHCAMNACRLEVALMPYHSSMIDSDVVASSKCSSAHTWMEEDDMVVQFDTNLAMRDFGLFNFDVRVVCGDSEQAKGRASAVVLYPDVLPGECVPRFSISDEHRNIKKPNIDNRGGMSHPIRLALEGCQGTAEHFQAQYYSLHRYNSPSLFVTPTAISEDAREAVNISIPHYGRKEVYTELVSTDGMQRVVAAGILTLRTQTQAEADARTEANHRFALFQRVVCAQCEKRTVECGCILGSQNPSLIVLSQFIERMLVVSLADVLKWIVVRPQGGLGNRNLQIVFGMMLALSTGR